MQDDTIVIMVLTWGSTTEQFRISTEQFRMSPMSSPSRLRKADPTRSSCYILSSYVTSGAIPPSRHLRQCLLPTMGEFNNTAGRQGDSMLIVAAINVRSATGEVRFDHSREFKNREPGRDKRAGLATPEVRRAFIIIVSLFL